MNTKDPSKQKHWPATLRADLMASVVVFLVALPLSMGIAIASGVPVATGLITAIVGGVIVGAFSGAPLQVSGPAAGLTVIVFEVVRQFGFEMLGVVVLIAGAFQLTAGLLRLGQWFRAVSPAVVKGMLAGIGVLIMVSQFHVMVDDKPSGSGLDDLLSIPSAIAKSVAIPDFEHQDVARFRMHALEQIGELHREQQYVRELVAETIPHTPGDDTAVVDAGIDMSPLLSDQEQIVQQLDAISRLLFQFEGQPDHGNRSKRIIAAAKQAMAACQDAQTAIETNDARTALARQHQAIDTLENLLGQLKNHHLAAEIGLLTIMALIDLSGVRATQSARAAGATGRGRFRYVDGSHAERASAVRGSAKLSLARDSLSQHGRAPRGALGRFGFKRILRCSDRQCANPVDRSRHRPTSSRSSRELRSRTVRTRGRKHVVWTGGGPADGRRYRAKRRQH